MKGYFWANLKGTIVNWEVRRFRLYRNTRPMDIMWELALEEGVVDEIMLMVPRKSIHTNQAIKDAGDHGYGDPLKQDRPKYPEAFLTVTDGRHVKGAKFRLKGISFLRFQNTSEGNDPYAPEKTAKSIPSEDFQILVSLDKVERTRVALPGK